MVRTSTELTALKCLGVVLALTGCGELGDEQSPDVETRLSALASDAFTNPNGAARVVTVDGTTIDQNNPFFQSLGTNGRACVNCHQPSAAMTITPPQIQAVFNATERHRSAVPVERRRERAERAGRDARSEAGGL